MKLKLIERIVRNKIALWLSYVKLIPITKKLDSNSVVFDCGANVGDITARFAKTGALVHAFEPDPIAFEKLKQRFIGQQNVILHHAGVWDREGEIRLFRHKDQDKTGGKSAFTVSSSIISNKINIDSSEGQMIRIIDLSAFIRNLGRPIDVIKLDVEGAETAILRKILEDETYACFKKMFVETHESKIPGQKKEIEDLKKLLAEKQIRHIHLNWL